MTREDRKVAIYAPPRFKATWRKFLEICEREGVSASHLVRVWVEGYVKRKDPGNPQPPITYFIEGHPDQLAGRRSKILARFVTQAAKAYGVVERRDIVNELRAAGYPGYNIAMVAESLSADLKKLGVKVLY